MTEGDYQLLNLRYSCPLLLRDDIISGKVPTAPTIASMMAALQVQECSRSCTACRLRPGRLMCTTAWPTSSIPLACRFATIA